MVHTWFHAARALSDRILFGVSADAQVARRQASAIRTRRECIHARMHSRSMLVPMSATRGMAKRAENAPSVLLQGRVSPETRVEVQQAAAASGVSIAYYLEALVADLVRENGALPLVDAPRPQREELPIPAA